jgi:UDP-N-acetylenolpyruvoylglucosamine reductase
MFTSTIFEVIGGLVCELKGSKSVVSAARSDLEGCEVVESIPGTLGEVINMENGVPKTRIAVMSGRLKK